jgi:ABC-2 type transport system permease protein
MSKRPKPQPFWAQLGDLFLIELTNWRWTWRRMIVLGMLAPLGGILGLKALLGNAGPHTLSYVLTGNIVLSLMFENQNRVGGHFVFMRFHGTLDHFGSLPIRQSALVLGVVLAFLVLSLPSVIVVILAGSLLLGLPLAVSPLVLLVVPLCALPMAAIGALIGVTARTSAEAGSLSLAVTIVTAGIGAVVIPPDRLPPWFVILGRLSPASYAGSAVRQVILGPVTPSMATDLAALIGFSLASLWIVSRKMDWRQQ